jgi:hypothetical protein
LKITSAVYSPGDRKETEIEKEMWGEANYSPVPPPFSVSSGS